MAETLKCKLCNKTKPGRFTRRKTDTKLDFPNWYCYHCVKLGEGRDEEAPEEPQMAPAKETVLVGEVLPVGRGQAELVKTKGQVIRLLPTLETEVKELSITNAEGYGYADALLGRVRGARAVWAPVWKRIQEKTIAPIREGLEELYSLNREVDGPLDKLEAAVKVKMKAFKVEEQRQIQVEKDKQEREARRLRLEAEEKERAAARAATPQMRGKLTAAAAQLSQKAAEVALQDAPEPTKGESSSDRKKPAWRIKDRLAFFAAIGDGTLPEDCAGPIVVIMNQYFKADPEGMKVWPGVEVYDDIQIVGR